MSNFQCSVIQYPSGRWGFVGSVPARLAYVQKNGEPLTDAMIEACRLSSNPGLFFKTRAWATEADALAALAQMEASQ